MGLLLDPVLVELPESAGAARPVPRHVDVLARVTLARRTKTVRDTLVLLWFDLALTSTGIAVMRHC